MHAVQARPPERALEDLRATDYILQNTQRPGTMLLRRRPTAVSLSPLGFPAVKQGDLVSIFRSVLFSLREIRISGHEFRLHHQQQQKMGGKGGLHLGRHLHMRSYNLSGEDHRSIATTRSRVATAVVVGGRRRLAEMAKNRAFPLGTF